MELSSFPSSVISTCISMTRDGDGETLRAFIIIPSQFASRHSGGELIRQLG